MESADVFLDFRLRSQSLTTGEAVGVVSCRDAVRHLAAYAHDPHSALLAFDLPIWGLRKQGRLDSVGPWSILIASALAGQVKESDVAGFDPALRSEFAESLRTVPVDRDLDAAMCDAVIAVATFGYTGVRIAKATKVAAAFRPRAVPVIDSFCCAGLGLRMPDSDSARMAVARAVVEFYASALRDQRSSLDSIRFQAAEIAPIYSNRDIISDLRLLDIVLWSSEASRQKVTGAGRRLEGEVARVPEWMVHPDRWVEPVFVG